MAEFELGEEGSGVREVGCGEYDCIAYDFEGFFTLSNVCCVASGAAILIFEVLEVFFCRVYSLCSLPQEILALGDGCFEVCAVWIDDIKEGLIATGIWRSAQEA